MEDEAWKYSWIEGPNQELLVIRGLLFMSRENLTFEVYFYSFLEGTNWELLIIRGPLIGSIKIVS